MKETSTTRNKLITKAKALVREAGAHKVIKFKSLCHNQSSLYKKSSANLDPHEESNYTLPLGVKRPVAIRPNNLGMPTPSEKTPQESRYISMYYNSSDDTLTSSTESLLDKPSMECVPPAFWFNSTPNGGASPSEDTKMVKSSEEKVSPSSSTRKASASKPAKTCLSHP